MKIAFILILVGVLAMTATTYAIRWIFNCCYTAAWSQIAYLPFAVFWWIGMLLLVIGFLGLILECMEGN